MPLRHFITSVPGVKIIEVVSKDRIILKGYLPVQEGQSCPRCHHSAFRIKATHLRKLKHGLWGGRLVYLWIRVPKMLCKHCARHFLVPIPGVLPRRRSTEQFRTEVFHLHEGGIPQSRFPKTHFVSASTVERWYQDFVGYRVRELAGRRCPVVMGIDEHFFSRKKGYATTIADLKNHKVFDVTLGRDDLTLGQYLSRLQGKERVKVVCMDLSETYRRIVKKHFPNAMIVADRFHVVRWINHQFLSVWKDIDPVTRKHRGMLSLMRRHPWNLTLEQQARLNQYFTAVPAMRAIYEFKNGLIELMLKKKKKRREVKDLIPQLLWHIEECRKSPFLQFQALARTLKSWLEPIARMWRFSKNNGITEGLHNKMEMISRRAFGFRNFENYRMRVIALCGWDGLFKRTR